jgi:hypothetical protein
MTVLDVNTIATDADLANEIGGADKLDRAMKREADRDAKRVRALEDVVEALQNRSPPVFEEDLLDPTELRRAVVARALHLICRSASAVPGDTWHMLRDEYRREYDRYVKTQFSLESELRAPSGFTIDLERR